MDNIRLQYINQLLVYARQRIWSEYGSLRKHMNLAPFEWTNIYLINNAINQEINTFFKLPNKAFRSDYHLPAMMTLALSTFIKNWIENSKDNKIDIGDVLLYNSSTFKVCRRNGNMLICRNQDKENTQIELKYETAKQFPIVQGGLRNRKMKNALTFYKDFFKELFDCSDSEIPYKFPNKTLVIASKKVSDSLNQYEFGESTFSKVIPYEYIWETRDGTIRSDTNLPVEPMIFIANNLETALRFLNKSPNINIDNIVFIGSSKYKDEAASITNALNNQTFKSCILIGNDTIENIPHLYKWTWETAELLLLDGKKIPKPQIEVIPNKEIESVLIHLVKEITKIEESYEVDLKELNLPIQKIITQVVPSNESKILMLLEEINENIVKECETILKEVFYEEGYFEEEYEEGWNIIKNIILNLINLNLKEINKVSHLKSLASIDYLVVPKNYLDLWKKELIADCLIICYRDYEKLNSEKPKRICFLNYYGKGQFKAMANSIHQHILILTNSQKELLDLHLAHYEQERFKEIQSMWRTNLSGFHFKVKPKEENVSELVSRLAIEAKNHDNYYFLSKKELSIELVFNDSSSKQYTNTQTIWTRTGMKIEEVPIVELDVGDKILDYQNLNKDKLYQLALNADNNQTFNNIENYSKLWREELIKHYESQALSLETYYDYFSKKGLDVSIGTFKYWLRDSYKNKFPQKRKNLKIIANVINSPCLNKELKQLLLYRNIYKSIMIGLGHSLSEDVFKYLKSKKKGKIFKEFSEQQIESIIRENIIERRVVETSYINAK